MADYIHQGLRFDFLGVNLVRAIDNLPQGKFVIAKNVRSYEAGVIQARPGQTALYADTLAQTNIHTIKRLNNDLSTASQAYTILVGAGTQLFSDNSIHTIINNSRASGFSGAPLSIIPFRPNNSPEPWAYIGDASKMGKLKVDGTFRNMGIAPPATYPTGPGGAKAPALNSFQSTTIEAGFSTAGYLIGPGIAGISVATGPTDTISGIVYDAGSTGWACVGINSPIDTRFYQVGSYVQFNTSTETPIIDSVYTPIKTTTIASITYDTGISGLCTIVLTSHKRKALVPNVLININGEFVRVLSVTFGSDDLPSLRCSTTGTHSAGETVSGTYSFRAFLANAHSAAETITFKILSVQGDTLAAGASITVAVQKNNIVDLSSVGGRPLQDSDEMNFEVFIVDAFATDSTKQPLVKEIQAILSIDQFNYYYIALKPSDTSSTISGQQTLEAARTSKISSDIVSQVDLPTDTSTAQLREMLQRRIAKATKNGNLNRVAKLQRKLAALPADGTGSGGGSGGGSGSGDGGGTTTSPTPALAAGSIQVGIQTYFPVRVKVSDLVRVGSDLTKGLADVQKIQVRIIAQNTTSAASSPGDFGFNFGSWWIGGAFGPDAGTAGIPYQYRYRYRASETGARSFPSPANRSGVIARRQRVQLSATASADPQVDKIDWFRYGGSLGTWTYIGTGPNSTATFNDDFPDDLILNNEQLTFEDFQPFPVVSTPINATGNASGTIVSLTSGSVSLSMAAGTEVIVNGIQTTLYAAPISTTKFEVMDNLNNLTGVSVFIPEPLIIGQPLPCMWGPFGQGFLGQVMFACGDTNNAGTAYWTNPDDPDSASDRNQIEVSSPSEPLMNGFLFNNTSYVFSSEELYVLYPIPTADGRLSFDSKKTGLKLGLAGRYAFCVGEGRVWFVSKDGIYVTEGSTPISITDDDLYPLFPHDGLPGVNKNGYIAPDFSQPNFLQLEIGDSILRFDFKGTDANFYTWLYDINTKAWTLDSYGRQVGVSYYDEGRGKHNWLMGGQNGKLYTFGGVSDDSLPIAGLLQSPSWNFGDTRIEKILGDYFFDVDPQGVTITVTPTINNHNTALTSSPITGASRLEPPQVIDIASGAGSFFRNLDFTFSWSSATATPKFYALDVYFLVKVADTIKRFTDWNDLGYSGPKLLRGLRVRADTSNISRAINLQYDGGSTAMALTVQHNGELWKSYDITPPVYAYLTRISPQDTNLWRLFDLDFIFDKYPDLDNITSEWMNGGYDGDKWLQGVVLRADTGGVPATVLVKSDDGNTIATLTCNHNGDQELPYSWNPYITHQMRLVPNSPTDNIRIINARWVFSPEPELTNNWITQPTSHGFRRFQHEQAAWIAVRTTTDLRFRITIDGVNFDYTITNAGGVYQKVYQSLFPVKGKVFQYSLTPLAGSTGFRVYEKDFIVKIKEWGSPGPYQELRPLGLPNEAPVANI